MHTHTVDPTVTHFCEASCPQCGYICQLPYGLSVQTLLTVCLTKVSSHQVMRKGSMIPLTGRCKKPSGLLKIQEMRQLRRKGIGLEPKRAVLPICVSCIANILADMHISTSVEMTRDTARKLIQSTLMSESYRTLMSRKIGYRIDCSGLGPVSLTYLL